jgi:lipopolysaccharide biosynthesis regulator YciM
VSLVTSRFSEIPEDIRKKVEPEFFSRHLDKYGEKRKFKLAYVAWLIKADRLKDAKNRLERIMSEKSGDAEVFSLVSSLLQKIRSNSGIDNQLYNSLVCNFFSTQLRFEKGYRCRKCGFQLDEMTWRCPRCSTWDSIAVR